MYSGPYTVPGPEQAPSGGVQGFVGGQKLRAEGKVCDRHWSSLHKGPLGFLDMRNCCGVFTDRTDVEGGIGIAMARGGEVQVE